MTFRSGSLVTATVYGKVRVGIVTRSSKAITYVQWNDAKGIAWMHTESLLPFVVPCPDCHSTDNPCLCGSYHS